ncbi:MAG: TlpA disulfide reductase family protein [Chitinophagales bacterium]|nr:TlpA family protein disulfide reductase [Bacteroidota bacterium]MCB9227070.1 TlpA family protein disulfide reductase [Chitinophagales bacterium]
MKKTFLLTFILILFLGVNAQDKSTVKKVFTEKEIPNLTLKDIYGKSINVADYGKNGKITVFSFWATWCSPCKKELNNISQLYEFWVDDYDMELVAISVDDARNTSKVKTYANGQAWEYDVLLDDNEDLKRLMNFQTVPYTVLVDQKGKVVYTHSGYVEGDEYILEEKLKALNNK